MSITILISSISGSDKLTIRSAHITDIPAIRAVAEQVWPVAYAQMITPAQIRYMLDMMYSDDSLQRQMQNEGCEFVLFEKDDVVSGFGAYSEIDECTFKLHKLYVLTTLHGLGVGSKLLNEICERVVTRGGLKIELQVNKNNPSKNFYLNQGFVIREELVLDIGDGFVMDDYIMEKKL